MSRLSLDQFKIDRVVLELRYANALLLWDKSGSLWHRIEIKHPNLKVVAAQPNQTVFNLGDEYQLSVLLERASILSVEPDKDLSGFEGLADDITEAITNVLDVVTFDRIGYRVTYFRPTKDAAEAVSLLLGTGLTSPPEGRLFNVDSATHSTTFVARYEDKERGALVRLESEGRKLEFEPPFGLKRLSPISEIDYGVTLDVDLYTTAPVRRGQFKASEWIRQASHLVRRDVQRFLR